VLDGLSRGNDGGIEHILVVDLAGNVVSLVDDSVDGRTGHRLWLLAQHLEHLLEALHVSLGLAEMRLQALLQLGVARVLDHIGQGFNDLVLGVVDVLQRVQEQVVHCLDVFPEQSHGDPCL
jgi:hypothetical protein